VTPTGSPAGIVRRDGRAPASLRPFEIVRGFTEFAAGSVLMTMGRTKVLCTASLDKEVPRWMQGRGRGWVTAEYSLLPGSSSERVVREATKGRQSGRTQEIQRLIGRSLRAICDLEALGERQVILDCDVLQADGGTRTAAVTGAYVALCDACEQLVQQGQLPRLPIIDSVAAVSVGIVDGVPLLDLDYEEDSRAGVDMNVVLTGSGKFVEVQGTAERDPFTRGELDELIDLASAGLKVLSDAQAGALALPLARNAPG
jgi:ribonuclease PH